MAAGLARAGVAEVAEVWCECPVPLLRERDARRRPDRHPVHGAPWSGAEWAHVVAHAVPLGLGRVLRLNTSGPVDVVAVAAWCRGAPGQPAPGRV